MADSTAQTYRFAAKEHLERARRSFADEDYFLSHYLSGLAVECHLRAWLRRKTYVFDSRHDLRELAKEAGFYNLLNPAQEDAFALTFGTLNTRWRSNHRYYSERQFSDYMNEIRAEWNKPGDRMKNLCRTVFNLALEVVNVGEAKWDTYAEPSKKNTG